MLQRFLDYEVPRYRCASRSYFTYFAKTDGLSERQHIYPTDSQNVITMF